MQAPHSSDVCAGRGPAAPQPFITTPASSPPLGHVARQHQRPCEHRVRGFSRSDDALELHRHFACVREAAAAGAAPGPSPPPCQVPLSVGSAVSREERQRLVLIGTRFAEGHASRCSSARGEDSLRTDPGELPPVGSVLGVSPPGWARRTRARRSHLLAAVCASVPAAGR